MERLRKNLNVLVQKIRERIKQFPLTAFILKLDRNLTFAFINGVFSIFFSTYWYMTLCASYVILALMTHSITWKPKKIRWNDNLMMFFNGLGMFALSVILCGLMILTILELRNPAKNKFVMIITAAYTYVFVTLTIRNMIVAHQKNLRSLIAKRNIACAGAILSILSLVRSMLGTFGDPSNRFSLITESVVGALAFFTMFGLGIHMIVLSFRKKR